MAQTPTETLAPFIADIRAVFAATKDPRAQAQGVAQHVRDLLSVPGSLKDHVDFSRDRGFGRVDLHQDDRYGHPGPGFLVMCAQLPPRPQATKSLTRGTPHDHGASWVEIHKTATVSDGPAVVLRIEGQAMDRVTRHRYDNAVEMFQAAGR